MPKVQITLSREQLQMIEKFKGTMGNTQASIIRNIVIAWLAEKSFISEMIKRMEKGEDLL